jgi:selenocysteine-specific elongation factor
MIVGTAGHIDHGKTELVRALTGVDTDRLREEKTRGISIDLGFAYLPTPDGHVIGFVDVPGHDRFIRNMLAGVTGIDFVLLVVAADDGVMPQTIEHLAIVSLLGIERGLVVVTKVDLVSPQRLDAAKAEITKLLAASSMSAAEIIPVSSVTGLGIDRLWDALFSAASDFDRGGATGRFRLAVDRSFSLVGSGTVVTGTILSGRVVIGDRVTISPSGHEAQVRSIHTQNRPAENGQAGDRCALNLTGRDIRKETIARGDMVLDPTLHAPTDRIDACVRVLPAESKSVQQWTPVRLHHATVEVAARIVPLSGEIIAPGVQALAQVVLERPIAAAAGDRFVLRDTSGQRTLGGGRFLDLRAPARRRRRPERLAQIAAHAKADPQDALLALLHQPFGFVDLSVFARDRALADDEVARMVAQTGAIRFIYAGGVLALAPARWSQLKASLRAALEKFHAEQPALPGIGIERLRLQLLANLPRDAFAAMLRGLVHGEEISLEGGRARLASHKIEMNESDKSLWREIGPLIGCEARFGPPRVRDIARQLKVPEPVVRRIMQLAGRADLVYEVAHDRFFLRATMAEIAEIIVALGEAAPGGAFSLAQLRDRLDTSRKIAMEILEFLDRHQATARRGDRRRVNAANLDVFRAVAA